jgi:Protein of unknown function (DUF3071)
LFVVGYSDDHGSVVLSTRKGAKSGSYLLELDEATLDVLEAAGRRRPGSVPASTRPGTRSELTPREIQARIRAGHSLEEVALEAGVGVDWIERFASPVLAEQAAAINRASGTVLHTSAAGPSDRPLEASVLRNLAGWGIVLDEREFQSAWSARHLDGSEWCVAFSFRRRGRDVVAEWTFDGHTGALNARNRPGEDLGYVAPRPDQASEHPVARPPKPVAVVSGPTGSPEPAPVGSPTEDRAESDPGAGPAPVGSPPEDRAPSGAGAGPAPVGPPPDQHLEPGPEVIPVTNGPAGAAPIEAPGGDRQPRLPLADLPRPASPPDAGSRD